MASGVIKANRKKTTFVTSYTFPKNAAEISGNNNKYTFTCNGVAFLEAEFADYQYSQVSLTLNGQRIGGPSITSASNNLKGVVLPIVFPVTKGDVLQVGYYSNYGLSGLLLYVFEN